MTYSLKLAERGRFTTHPNPNVGCVIVNDNKIVGEGFHRRAGEMHAEIHALQMAGEKAKGSTAYITLEPCSHYGLTPPCCDAIIKSGVSRVVVAMQDANPQISGRGLHRLEQAGLKVRHGFMIKEAERLNKGFLKRMRTGFPYVQIKLGASLDGRVAMSNGESKWITSSQSRRDVQYLRAQSHAILTSSSTVLKDDPALTVRWNELNAHTQSLYPQDQIRQPLRIVIDTRNRVSPKNRIVNQIGETWLIRKQKDDQYWSNNVRQILFPECRRNIDLTMLMLYLGKQQINSILVEAGPTLSGALIQSRLVDEVIIYLSPKILGVDACGLFALPGIKSLDDALNLSFKEMRRIGPDICLHLVIV